MPEHTELIPVSATSPDIRRKTLTVKSESAVDPESQRDTTVYATTDVVDGDNEVVLPGGCIADRFEQNPVILLSHSMGQPGTYGLPVGKAVGGLKRRPHGILVGIYFSRDTAMGREVKALWDEGCLNAVSIGFRSLEASWMTYEEAQSRPDWKAAYERTNGKVLVHRKYELLEISIVAVPSNPQALRVKCAAAGLAAPSWLSLPNPETRAMPDIPRTKNTSRFDLGRKALDDAADGIAAADVTPADARMMVALIVPPETASAIAIPGGESPEDLHLTLCYLGRAIEIGSNALDWIKQMCRDVAASTPLLLGKIGGFGRFSASDTSDGKDVIYASADLPELAACRERLANILQYSGIAYSKAHGFTPHITLAYVDPEAESPVTRIEPTPVAFTHLCLVIEGKAETFPFNTLSGYMDGPYYRSIAGTENKTVDDADDKAAICKRVAAVAKTIKHCGDYGQAYYNHAEKAVHHTMADGDGEPEFDGSKEIERKYMAIPGIKKVRIGDEYHPSEDEGYEQVHPPKGKAASAPTVKCMGGKSLALGDHVRDIRSGVCGEVKSLHTDGHHPLEVAADGDDDPHLEATEDNPVAIVHHHDKGCERSGEMHALHTKGLAVIPKDMDGDGDGDDIETEGIKGQKAMVPPPDPYDDETPAPTTDRNPDPLPAATFRRGDAVSINLGNGRKAYGTIHSIHAHGDFVPDVDDHVMGTEDDPAARVHRHKAVRDGFVKTGYHTAHSCKSLTRLEGGLAEPSPQPQKALSRAGIAQAEPPIVISGGLTPEERQQAALASLTKALSPEGIREAVRGEARRLAGVIGH